MLKDNCGNEIPSQQLIHDNVFLYQIDRFLAQYSDFFSAFAALKQYYPEEMKGIDYMNEFRIFDQNWVRYDCIYQCKALVEAARNVTPPKDKRSKIVFKDTSVTSKKKEALLKLFQKSEFFRFLNINPGYFSNTMIQMIKQYSDLFRSLQLGEMDSETRDSFLRLELQLRDELGKYKIYRGSIAAERKFENPLVAVNRSYPKKSPTKTRTSSTLSSMNSYSYPTTRVIMDEKDMTLTREEMESMYYCGDVEEEAKVKLYRR